MKHHVMGCLENEPPNTILLHHETKDFTSEKSAEKIANNIRNVALLQSKMTSMAEREKMVT